MPPRNATQNRTKAAATSQPRRQGQIVPKGDQKWLIRFFAGVDPRTNKRNYDSEAVKGTYKQAQIKLGRRLHEVAEGTYRAPLKQTLGAFLQEEWLRERAADVKAGTLSHRAFGDYERA